MWRTQFCYYLEITATTKVRGHSEYVLHDPMHLDWLANQPQWLEKRILPPRKTTIIRTINDLQDWQKLYIQIFTTILFCSEWSGLHSSMAFLPRSVKYCTPFPCILDSYILLRHHNSHTEICMLLGYYAAYRCKFLTDVSGQPTSPIFKGLEIRHHTLRNIPHERRTHLHRAG